VSQVGQAQLVSSQSGIIKKLRPFVSIVQARSHVSDGVGNVLSLGGLTSVSRTGLRVTKTAFCRTWRSRSDSGKVLLASLARNAVGVAETLSGAGHALSRARWLCRLVQLVKLACSSGVIVVVLQSVPPSPCLDRS
jgi:hypothetical protein